MKIMFKLREDNAREIFCYSKRLNIRDIKLSIWWVQPLLYYTEEQQSFQAALLYG